MTTDPIGDVTPATDAEIVKRLSEVYDLPIKGWLGDCSKQDVDHILARLAASEAERDALKAENAAILGDKADEFLKMNTEIRRLQSIIDSGAKDARKLAITIYERGGNDPSEVVDYMADEISDHVSRILAEKLPIVAGDRELAEIITAYACGEFTTDGFEEIIAAYRAEVERPLVEMVKRLAYPACGMNGIVDKPTWDRDIAAARQLLAERGA